MLLQSYNIKIDIDMEEGKLYLPRSIRIENIMYLANFNWSHYS